MKDLKQNIRITCTLYQKVTPPSQGAALAVRHVHIKSWKYQNVTEVTDWKRRVHLLYFTLLYCTVLQSTMLDRLQKS